MIFRRKKENLSFVQAAKKHNEKYEKEKILREKKEKRKKDIIYFLIKVKSYIIFITNKEEKSFAQVVEKQNERYEKEKIFREKKEKRKKNTIFLLKEDEKSFAQVVEEHNERYEKEKIFREKKEKRKKDIINFLLKAKNSTIFFLQEQCKKWMNFLAQQYKRWMNFLAQQDKKKWIIVLKVNLVYYACYIKEDLDLEMTRRYIAVLKPVTTKEECEREGTNQNARPKKKRDWLAIPPHEDAEEWLIKPLRTREMKEMVLFTKEFNEKRKKEMMNFLLKAKNFLLKAKNFMILLPKLGARFIVIYLLATLLINGPIVYADAPSPWQAGFQDPATPIMEGIFFFNGLLMSFMLLIACLVGWLLFRCVILFNEFENSEPVSFNHSTVLEVVWTICPALVLMGISIPSYNLLYAMEEVIDPGLTIKVVGHQWYWSYEVSDFEGREVQEKEPFILPRSQAEIYKSEAEWNEACVASLEVKSYLDDAGQGLRAANTNYSRICLDLMAARFNKAVAAYFCAFLEDAITNPHLIRAKALLHRNYAGFLETPGLKGSTPLEKILLGAIDSQDYILRPENLISKLIGELSPEQFVKIQSIASSAGWKLHAVGKSDLELIGELGEAKTIFYKAERELEVLEGLFNEAKIRRENSLFDYEITKAALGSKKPESVAALGLYEEQVTEPENDNYIYNPEEEVSCDILLDRAVELYSDVGGIFNRYKTYFSGAELKLEGVIARLIRVENYCAAVKRVVEDTPSILDNFRTFNNPRILHDSFEWGDCLEDLQRVESQLKSAKSRLGVAELIYAKAKKDIVETSGTFVGGEIGAAKMVVELAKADNLVFTSDRAIGDNNGFLNNIVGEIYRVGDDLFNNNSEDNSNELLVRVQEELKAPKNYNPFNKNERESVSFDSYLIPEEELTPPSPSSPGSIFRLLEVDNRLFVPVGTHIRVLVTSADVLHSWAVPSLGVKIDACPGRLNQILIFIKRKGVFYGQCSEICGINHGFMPIVIESVSKEDYLTWVGTKLCS